MNNRKLLLAKVRKGNYAHAGEEEAIDLTMNLVEKNPGRLVLDLGCGLGGTANYVQNNNWGKVVGLDVDESVLESAREFYPHIRFELGDATRVDSYDFFKNDSFDLFCSFNAFFCFPAQENCLKAIAKIANKNAELLIFDYSARGSLQSSFSVDNPLASPFTDHKAGSRSIMQFSPINITSVREMLERCQWELIQIVNLNEKYKQWYQSLIEKMEADQHSLIEEFGKTTFDDLYIGYKKLSELMDRDEIGGCILHAKLK